MADEVKNILSLPYSRLLIPDETGGYSAEILEFPGCFAEGDSAEETIRNLEDAAKSWVEAALAKGIAIPPATGGNEYSGNFALRLPRSLHGRAARYAQQDGVSLNQFIIAAVAERVGSVKAITTLQRQVDKVVLVFSELKERIGNDTRHGVNVNLANLDKRAEVFLH